MRGARALRLSTRAGAQTRFGRSTRRYRTIRSRQPDTQLNITSLAVAMVGRQEHGQARGIRGERQAVPEPRPLGATAR